MRSCFLVVVMIPVAMIPVFTISAGSLQAQESSAGHSPSDRIFETPKVDELHFTMSPEQFEKLTPKGVASPFGPPGGPRFGPPKGAPGFAGPAPSAGFGPR